ncbi:MAG TPA: cytochrome c biogenesis protein CcsA [Rhodocyclaceae bacterium]|nr:cytochrome c biogenesis protein CcsA [Rhodocyclaceae bacterium]HNL22025.1 cytochrome c biogenesis protein CcsA [Rhodocyclaceae bacterium]HNM21134.1 cytochrome c biogenesis protein CcsA [Rhodocyclaceae bacterium]HNM81222.1 cytochrome c biogenesis protein CcsA [Rhodocyclaceae bacterium]
MPHILAAALYGGLGYHFWNSRWRETDKPRVAVPMQSWERAAIALAMAIHAYGIEDALFSDVGMRFSFSFALSLMMVLAVFIYWLESFMARMEGLQPLVLPLAAVCALLPAVFPHVHLVAHAEATGFKLHFLAAMLAYSLFTLSALHAIFMGFTERALHQRSLTRSLTSLPPLMTMESLLFRMLLIGFILLTLTLGSGVLFSEQLFGKALSLDHKTLFAFAAWVIFAILLVGRHVRGWRGRTALRWTLSGFAVLLLAYIGSRFVAEVLLGR